MKGSTVPVRTGTITSCTQQQHNQTDLVQLPFWRIFLLVVVVVVVVASRGRGRCWTESQPSHVLSSMSYRYSKFIILQ